MSTERPPEGDPADPAHLARRITPATCAPCAS